MEGRIKGSGSANHCLDLSLKHLFLGMDSAGYSAGTRYSPFDGCNWEMFGLCKATDRYESTSHAMLRGIGSMSNMQ